MVEVCSIGQGGKDVERDPFGRQLRKDVERDFTGALLCPSGCIRGAESFLGSAAVDKKEAECRAPGVRQVVVSCPPPSSSQEMVAETLDQASRVSSV